MLAKNRNLVIAISIFLFALIVRLLFIFTLGADERIYDSLYDQYIYIDLAKSIIAGRGLSLSVGTFVADAYTPTSIQPPVYPLVLSALFYLFGENYLSVRLLQAALSAGVCAVTYLVARKILGRAVSLLAVLIVCVYPPLIMYTRPIMTEILYTFLLSLIVLLLVKFALETFRLVHFVIWGALFGLTFLVRPEVLAFAPIVALFIFWWTLTQKKNTLRSISVGITLAALTFVVVIGPWAVRNWHVHGEPLVFPNKRWTMWEQNWLRYMRETSPGWQEGCDSEDELMCAIPNFEDLSELERDRYTSKLGIDFIVSHPALFARYAVSRFLASYPIIPREELPPPIGYKGVRERPLDGYHYTSLDDSPLYLTGTEKLRVWSFRFILVLAVLGLAMAVKRRVLVVILPSLPIFANIGTALLSHGKERLRLPVDPYLIVIAAYSLVSVVDYLKTVFVHRQAK